MAVGDGVFWRARVEESSRGGWLSGLNTDAVSNRCFSMTTCQESCSHQAGAPRCTYGRPPSFPPFGRPEALPRTPKSSASRILRRLSRPRYTAPVLAACCCSGARGARGERWQRRGKMPFKLPIRPNRMIAGSAACNAVLRWRLNADNGPENARIAVPTHFDCSPLPRRPLRASGGLAQSAAAQQYRSVQSHHTASRQGLNLQARCNRSLAEPPGCAGRDRVAGAGPRA